MKYNVLRIAYGPGANGGFIAQAWDIEKIREPHRSVFEAMQARGHVVHVDGDLVYLIGGYV